MNIKAFCKKWISPYVAYNLLAMAIVVTGLCVGVKYALSSYTHHGEGIELPNLYGMDYQSAMEQLEKKGIHVEVNDTGRNKSLDADVILLQTPGAGTKVKEGRTIFVTINSKTSPKIRIPDVIDNSSYREAQAMLRSKGFQVLEPKLIDGERDWVYGMMADGKNLQTGDMVSTDIPLVLVIGNGISEEEDEEDAMLAVPEGANGDEDDFEEVVLD